MQKPSQQQRNNEAHKNHNTNNNNNHISNSHTTNSATSDTSSASFQQRFDFNRLKARLPELNCLHSLQRYWQQQQQQQSQQPHNENSDILTGSHRDESGGGNSSYYTTNILGCTISYPFGKEPKSDGTKETPLQKFYRHQQQKKMPAFRGRRGWCGCFQVSVLLNVLPNAFTTSARWVS